MIENPVIFFTALAGIVLAFGTIVRKAGYSSWWILVGLVPLVNVAMFVLFALRRWPIEKELARLRVMAEAGTRDDFGCLLSTAISAERKGDVAAASELFALLVSNCEDDEIRSHAQHSLKCIESSSPEPGNPGSSPGGSL